VCEPVTLSLAAGTLAGGLSSAAVGVGSLSAASALGLGATVASGVLSAAGAYQQGQAAKAVGRNNQIMAEYAAQDALRRGEEDAIKVRQQTDKLKGTQRASMAAKGLDLSEGTPAALIEQTDFFGAVDATTARDNAKRDAWSARTGGANARAQGDAAAKQGTLSAFSTLLGTGAQVAGKWYLHNGQEPATPGKA
jgi:hypothetical protein